jgi:uncharacterized MAPEG superfamily protein
MSNSALALTGYAAWTIVLLLGIAAMRVSLTLAGRRAANSFAPDGADVSPLSHRVCRAHANCYENLPVFASLILVALVTGHAAITDGLALWVLAARVGQSTVHVVSTSSPAVLTRFTFFVVQVAVQIWWVVALLGA